MAINKKSAPLWTKIVIVFVAVTFVASIALVGFSGFGTTSNPGSPTTGGDPITLQYQPQVEAALAASKADPTSAPLLANVGHVYYEWAVAEYESGAIDASRPHWLAAVAYYDQAIAINPTDNVAIGNKSFALAYAGSPDAEAALKAFIATEDPTLAPQIANAQELLAQIQSSAATGSTATSSTP
ncbi:MAG: hypothetical protein CVT66_09855 [Actinobacteria bacterium HGW-Actinobacteria-6]|nr:MAG: hypothetical protein CVT66_09855 [Actinobacteria bacterium HGW-Actinobacteria-6]